MTLRYALLAAGAAGVVLMGVYLFVEVRAAPAPVPAVAQVAPPDRAASRPAPLPVRPAVRPVTHAPAPAPAPAPAAPSAPQRPGVMRPAPSLAGEHVAPADVKLVEVMDEANKAYDMQDYDQAMEIAQKVLAQQPGNVRMLRVMVSSSCIGGDPAVGQKYFDQLPRYDRDQMNTRCSRYGVTFKDPAQ